MVLGHTQEGTLSPKVATLLILGMKANVCPDTVTKLYLGVQCFGSFDIVDQEGKEVEQFLLVGLVNESVICFLDAHKRN